MRRRLALLLLASVLLSGCGPRPRIGTLSETSVILAFGDSLTAGTGAARSESYPAVLSRLTGCRVVNAGVPGEEAPAGLRRLPSVLARERPNLVVLCHGGNDMLRGRNRNAIKTDLGAMISAAKATGADVILIGVPSPDLRLRTPDLYRELAHEHRIPAELECVPRILSAPALKSDPAHPNAAGYKRLAEAIFALVERSSGGAH